MRGAIFFVLASATFDFRSDSSTAERFNFGYRIIRCSSASEPARQADYRTRRHAGFASLEKPH